MPVFECSRKVQVLGSSLAMTIPALFVKVNEVKKGQEVSVIFGLDGVLVLSSLEDYEAIREQLLSIIEGLDKRIVEKDSNTNEE
jgi:antitoxin component of MazEF toxin-antitoxin module